MEQAPSFQRQTPNPELDPWNSGKMLARFAAREISLVAASACNWPDFTQLGRDEVVVGSDGLIRVALPNASAIYVAVLHSRKATLLTEGENAVELRCLVLGNAYLDTRRPLSGFLLQPVNHLGRNAAKTGKLSEQRTDEMLDAFPVRPNGEKTPPDGP